MARNPLDISTLTGAAKLGRNGDQYLVHASPGDVVIPGDRAAMNANPLAQILGQDIMRFTVGHTDNSINPKTGLREFMDPGGGGGGGDSGGGGGGAEGGGSESGGGAGVGEGGGVSSGGGLGGPAAGEHGAEKGNATGTDASGMGAGGGVSAGDVTGGLAGKLSQPGEISNPAAPGIDVSRTSSNVASLAERAFSGFMSSLGYNTSPGLASNTGKIGDIFGNVNQAGFNSNAFGNALGLASMAGVPGAGLLSAANTAAKSLAGFDFGRDVLGLQGPNQGLGGLLGEVAGNLTGNGPGSTGAGAGAPGGPAGGASPSGSGGAAGNGLTPQFGHFVAPTTNPIQSGSLPPPPVAPQLPGSRYSGFGSPFAIASPPFPMGTPGPGPTRTSGIG